jgi:hypothetical protein
VSRTLNPLHFEDLEPHRFEDLVRQLAYDFKPWRKLEATGRAGSDDGFDARGYEIVATAGDTTDPDPGDETPGEPPVDDRPWLIQCKRERSIGPKKLLEYLNDIPEEEARHLHGMLFVAPCDFSKRARDGFYASCAELGITELHLWGRAELEDQLFQPKNDHLLFAYFGFSLQIRRRSQRSELRSMLAIKRKAHRVLDEYIYRAVLLRDPSEKRYPFDQQVPGFEDRPPWTVVRFEGFTYFGLKFRTRSYLAYLSDDRTGWDATLRVRERQWFYDHDNPWKKVSAEDNLLCQQAELAWEALPDKNRARLDVYEYISYQRLIDIDELGDDIFEGPHLFVPFDIDGQPYSGSRGEVQLEKHNPQEDIEPLLPDSAEDRRAVIFSAELRSRKTS